jgi:hypothetical protein
MPKVTIRPSAATGGALASFAEFVEFAKNVIGRQHEHKARRDRVRRREGWRRPPQDQNRGASVRARCPASTPRSRNCSATTKRKSALGNTIGV